MSAFLKDLFRQISRNLPRFIAIVLIVSLGVAFFVGIGSTGNSMRVSVDKYYEQYNGADLHLMSTWGFEEADIAKLGSAKNVSIINARRSFDTFLYKKSAKVLVRFQSFDFKSISSNNTNLKNKLLYQPDMVSGSYPAERNECIVDKSFASEYELLVGDEIEINPANDKDAAENLEILKYKISGIFNPLEYFSLSKGTSNKGSGSVVGHFLVYDDVFSADYYTDIYLKLDTELSRFSKEYKKIVDETEQDIKSISEKINSARFERVNLEAEAEIVEAKTELNDGKKKLSDSEAELKDGWAELEQGEKDYADGLKTFNEEFASAEEKLKDAKKTLDESINTLESKKQAYIDGLSEYQNGFDEWQSSGETLAAVKSELDLLPPQIENLENQIAMLPADSPLLPTLNENLATIKTAYTYGMAEYEAGMAQYLEGKAKLEESKATLDYGKNELDKGFERYDTGLEEYNESYAAFSAKKIEESKKLEDGKNELEESRKKLEDGQKEFDEKYADAISDIKEGEKELEKAEKDLSELKKPELIFLGLDKNYAFESFRQDSERIDVLSTVFPLVFFIVAALVSMTNMTRMVEDDRTNIGIYKAIGYKNTSISMKYLFYAGTATILGVALGLLYGSLIFPYIIYNAYAKTLYTLPKLTNVLEFSLAFGAGLAAIASTILPTYLVSRTILRDNAASLMRPRAPRNGKKVLVERIGFIWKRFNFSLKVTARNIFRYKKRLFMTIIGILGCTALVFTGFAFKESVSQIVPRHFNEIHKYDIIIKVDKETEKADYQNIKTTILEQSSVKDILECYLSDADIKSEAGEESLNIVVPYGSEGMEKLNDFIIMKDRKSKKSFNLGDEGAVITEKIADELEISVGDVVKLTKDDKTVEVKIASIMENYIYHYVYLSPAYYSELFGEETGFSTFYVKKTDSGAAFDSDKVLENSHVSSIVYTAKQKQDFEDTMGALDMVIVVLIISAAVLAFVVLFSLNSINIDERKRELATLKVLGFYDIETTMYLFRENVFLTLIGIVAGLFAGIWLTFYLISTVEIDMVMFIRSFSWYNYAFAGAITLVFTVIVNIIMSGSVKKISMVESLKSVE